MTQEQAEYRVQFVRKNHQLKDLVWNYRTYDTEQEAIQVAESLARSIGKYDSFGKELVVAKREVIWREKVQ